MSKETMKCFNEKPWELKSNILEWALKEINKKEVIGVTIRPPHKDKGLWVLGEMVITCKKEIIGFRYKRADQDGFHKIVRTKKQQY